MQRFEHRFTAMGGTCRIEVDHEIESTTLAALRAAESEVRRLEEKYSRYRSDSLISKINNAAGSGREIGIDTETSGLLDYAHTLWQQSGSLFDITSGVLRKAWNFKDGAIATPESIAQLLPLVGWQKVLRTERSVQLPQAGMELDMGGYVKEYACDSVTTVLRDHNIEHALVNLAGDMAFTGAQGDGKDWQIGIRHPREEQHAIATIALRGGGLATSGDYERFLLLGDQRYSHILNPNTGWPVAGLLAVSVVADQCLVAGSAATIAMLKPAVEGLGWLEELGLPWLAVDPQLKVHRHKLPSNP